jgi:hypothetical protein
MADTEYCLVFGSSAIHGDRVVREINPDMVRAMGAAVLYHLADKGVNHANTVLVATPGTGLNYVPIDLYRRGFVKDLIITVPPNTEELEQDHARFSAVVGHDTLSVIRGLYNKWWVAPEDANFYESVDKMYNSLGDRDRHAVCLTAARYAVEPDRRTRAAEMWRAVRKASKVCIAPDSELGQRGFVTPYSRFNLIRPRDPA